MVCEAKRGMHCLTVVFERRSNVFRYAFAAAVGKKMFSERLSSGQKNIIEHHRAVHWSETEYFTLMQLVKDNDSLLQKDLDSGLLPSRDWMTANPGNVQAEESSILFEDYCNMLSPVAYMNPDQLRAGMEFGGNS